MKTTQALAASPAYWHMARYRDELARIARNGETRAETHERVKAWAERLQRKAGKT
jgi:broad specificity phosphatase PhoE